MQKINLNSNNTPFTVDMYQTFNGDGNDDQIIEAYNEQNNTDYSCDDFDWSYNTKAILEGLSNKSIEYIKDNHTDDIIIGVELVSTSSPKYYNYTTDSHAAAYQIDDIKLLQYINKNKDDFFNWCKDQPWHIDISTDILDDNMLIYYISKLDIDREDYFYDLYEVSGDLWYENTEYKLIK